jgi:transcriptional regulator with XRE-family HTH domain
MIRKIRRALGMTQAQLAARADLPQSHLAKIETGRVDVQIGTLKRILRALHCELVLVPRFLKTPRQAVRERIQELSLSRSERKRLRGRASSRIWEDRGGFVGASLVRDMPVRLVDKEDDQDALRYWLSQPPEARIDAMEFLRRQACLVAGREELPRLARSIKLRARA